MKEIVYETKIALLLNCSSVLMREKTADSRFGTYTLLMEALPCVLRDIAKHFNVEEEDFELNFQDLADCYIPSPKVKKDLDTASLFCDIHLAAVRQSREGKYEQIMATKNVHLLASLTYKLYIYSRVLGGKQLSPKSTDSLKEALSHIYSTFGLVIPSRLDSAEIYKSIEVLCDREVNNTSTLNKEVFELLKPRSGYSSIFSDV